MYCGLGKHTINVTCGSKSASLENKCSGNKPVI